ncbi:MAG: Amuc_1098 family type IV pilus outer membrane protein [Roseimicrobium sp.]
MTTRINRSQTMKQMALSCLSIALCSTIAVAASGGSSGSVSGIVERELARRQQRVQDAQTAITKGDALYAEGEYVGALNEFKVAIDLLPDAPMTAAAREIAISKYCDAAVELARERAKNGRYPDAKALLNDALVKRPGHKKAEILLEQLDDPDRFEPGLTPEHVKNVQEVERNLQLGYSYYNLGDYDKALKSFQGALRVDPYNSAARRGMERTEMKRSEYFDSSRDHLRSKMLNEVNRGWEDAVPAPFLTTPGGGVLGGGINPGAYYTEKMQKIIFPQVQFQGASIEEAVEFLRIKSKDYDTVEKDPAKRGVNLLIKPGTAPSTATISLDLRDVPMTEALRYITELGGMKFKIEPFAVVVVPLSDVGTEQYTRTFKVPPDFLSLGGAGGGAAAPAAPADPFAPAGGGAGASTLGVRKSALDILKEQGIQFPENSSAVFVAATSQLIVKNTQPNLDQVEAFVDELIKKVPQQIYITTKFVEVSQKNTDEVGFDWLLGAFNTGSNRVFGSGGTVGNAAAGAVSGTDFPFTAPGVGNPPVGQFPITRGNRSGNVAVTPDSIDGLIAGITAAQTALGAPGIFSLAGVFTDPQFQLVIHALAQRKGVDLMSAPSVTTRSGQRATIEVVREFIYPTEFDPPQIPQTVGATTGASLGGASGASTFPVTPTTPTAFEMRPVGVRMEVDPVIGPDGYTIDLNLAPEVTEFEGFINYGSPINTASIDALGNPTTLVLTDNIINQPIFSTRKVTTAVTVWDGQTVAMGGLIREDVQDVEDKVPFLGDIPILGRLFQSKAEDHFKRNLMIFVTAKLIDPSGLPIHNANGSQVVSPEAAGANALLPPPQ